jgi:hypothetical protein
LQRRSFGVHSLMFAGICVHWRSCSLAFVFADVRVGVHVALVGIGVAIRWHWYSLALVFAGVGVLVRWWFA